MGDVYKELTWCGCKFIVVEIRRHNNLIFRKVVYQAIFIQGYVHGSYKECLRGNFDENYMKNYEFIRYKQDIWTITIRLNENDERFPSYWDRFFFFTILHHLLNALYLNKQQKHLLESQYMTIISINFMRIHKKLAITIIIIKIQNNSHFYNKSLVINGAKHFSGVADKLSIYSFLSSFFLLLLTLTQNDK